MRNILLTAGAVVLAAIVVGLFVSGQLMSLPWMFLAALQGPGQGERPTITWSSPTPTPPPTNTPSPTLVPTALSTFTPTAVPPTPTPVSTATPTVHNILYSVQPGDTLGSVAAMFGVKQADILKANNLSPGSTLYPGQVLVIPNPRTTPTPVPAWTPTPTGTATP